MRSTDRKKITNSTSTPFISKTIKSLCLYLLLLNPSLLLAQDITVPNTEQTTIQQAIDAISGSGTITILRGDYSESLVIRSDITLQGEETAQVKIISPDSGPAIDLTGINNVTIRNLSITSSSIGIQITNSTNINIHNNVFALGANASPDGTAIDLVDTSSSVTIEQNTFFANNLAIKKAEDSVIKYNIFYNNTTALETGFGDSNTDLNCIDVGTGLGTNIIEIDPDPVIDPMFADQSLNDFHLKQDSPCIDTIAGFTDVIDSTDADMGAYGGPDMDLLPFPPQIETANVVVDSNVTPHTVNITWNKNLSYLVTNTNNPGGYLVHYDTEQPDITNPVYDGIEAGNPPSITTRSPVNIDAPGNTLLLEFLPTNLELTAGKPVVSIAPSSQTLDVSWPAVENASSYTVHYGINAITDNTQTDITDTSFSITGLINNETYQVAVSAIHQPKIFIAVTTFDNTNTDPNNANISDFSTQISQDIGDPKPTPSDTVTAIPELIQPFPDLPGEGCFIATAAWGYYSAPQVQLLRDFRDQYLLTNKPGRLFVQWYYTHGPDAAQQLNANPQFKPLVRAMLYPLIVFAQYMLNSSPPLKIFISILMLLITILFAAILKTVFNKSGLVMRKFDYVRNYKRNQVN